MVGIYDGKPVIREEIGKSAGAVAGGEHLCAEQDHLFPTKIVTVCGGKFPHDPGNPAVMNGIAHGQAGVGPHTNGKVGLVFDGQAFALHDLRKSSCDIAGISRPGKINGQHERVASLC